jgi:Periplasmic binding protein domain
VTKFSVRLSIQIALGVTVRYCGSAPTWVTEAIVPSGSMRTRLSGTTCGIAPAELERAAAAAAEPERMTTPARASFQRRSRKRLSASQIDETGEYAILEEQHQYPIAGMWEKDVEGYIPKAYPNMKLDGVLNLTGAGDQAEVDAITSFMSAHPNLKGLIGIAPTEAYMAAQAITQTGKIGQIFSAGNGGDALEGTPLVGWINSGAMEDVIGGDPVKLGYLTVWAAHRLLTGRHFKRGVYRLGEWGLRVSYYPQAPRVAARPATHDHQGEPGAIPRVAVSPRWAIAAGEPRLPPPPPHLRRSPFRQRAPRRPIFRFLA